MTEKQIQRQIEVLRDVTEELLQDKEAALKVLKKIGVIVPEKKSLREKKK